MTATPVFPVSLSHNYAEEVRQQWERFVSGKLLETDSVRPVVRESWIWCRDFGLDPLQPPLSCPVSEEALTSLRDEEPLYRHGAAVLENVTDTLFLPPRSLLVLTNHLSQAVHITGDPRAVAAVTEANIVAGADVGESAIGTNVISLARRTGQPSVTYRAEHYSASLQAWQSCAVPLWRSQTDQLAGVISLCSLEQYEWRPAFHALNQISQWIALLMENEEKGRRCLLLEEHQHRHLQCPTDAILTVDSEGVIQALSPAFAHLTGSVAAQKFFGASLSVLGLEIPGWTDLTHNRFPAESTEVTVRFLKRGDVRTAAVIPVHGPKRARPVGYTFTFPLPLAPASRPRVSPTSVSLQRNRPGPTFATLIGTAPTFVHAVELARIAARYDDPLLITGESGTGKELIAQSIHHASPRSHGPFIAVNCAGASEEIIVAELFGYTAGAFTGALREGKRGKFELAHTGTLFLDEVSDMPLKMQQVLLRALEERTITPLGTERSRPVDVRIIAATNAKLSAKIRDGAFRLDLFHRLNVLPILLPPLGERPEDIPLLIEHFLSEGDRHLVIAPETMDCLRAYAWPGNVRELKNVVVRWLRFAPHEVITPTDLPPEMHDTEKESAGLKMLKQEREKESIIAALQKSGGSVSRAAHALSVSRVTLYRKIKEHHLSAG
jgi:sigma-54 dependent transcriptional regulator, acetoin dehydrogenase operon transcriptional activator AcoR